MKNMEEIESLCTGCGTCAALCPKNAIEMRINNKRGVYGPTINGECDECMTCFETCPGIAVNFEELNKFVFQEKPKDTILGTYKNIYIGCSLDERLRFKSSSGGVVPQLLVSLLDKKIIDGALVTKMKKDDPLRPKAFIATTRDEVIDAIGAKYCPVPVNVALKEILDSNLEKFAVVGLPCHIQGLRKAEKLNKKLKKKIVLHIGLFCSHGITFLATQYLFYKLGITKNKIKEISYRTGEFPPGHMLIKLVNGNTKKISHVKFWNLVFNHLIFCSTKRCMACYDQTCELADISIGSGWFPYLQYNVKNHSVIITRNEFADKLMERLNGKEMKISNVEDNELKKLKKMQKFKKDFFKTNVSILKLFGNEIPSYEPLSFRKKIPTKMYIASLIRYIRTKLSTKKYLWPIFKFLKDLDRY